MASSPPNSPSFSKTFLAKIKGHAWIDIKENALWCDDFRRKPSHYLFGGSLLALSPTYPALYFGAFLEVSFLPNHPLKLSLGISSHLDTHSEALI